MDNPSIVRRVDKKRLIALGATVTLIVSVNHACVFISDV
jgi:hypothetical protein